MEAEVQRAAIDSLKRQIVEVKRQIDQIKNGDKSKFLEIRRKSDQRKARVVLVTLKLKKQLNDCQQFLEENRKKWSKEQSASLDVVMVVFT